MQPTWDDIISDDELVTGVVWNKAMHSCVNSPGPLADSGLSAFFSSSFASMSFLPRLFPPLANTGEPSELNLTTRTRLRPGVCFGGRATADGFGTAFFS